MTGTRKRSRRAEGADEGSWPVLRSFSLQCVIAFHHTFHGLGFVANDREQKHRRPVGSAANHGLRVVATNHERGAESEHLQYRVA